MHSICSRSSLASRRAASIIVKGTFESDRDSWNSPLRTTATLRCGEENSSAKIFIRNSPLSFSQGLDGYPEHRTRRTVDCGLLVAPKRCGGGWALYAAKPSFRPFNHCHAVGI